MNFNRFQCQQFLESELGCSDYTQLSTFKDVFSQFVLTSSRVADFKLKAKEDGKDIYYKALMTFLEATHGMKLGQSSWPIVKLYYSLFYSLRVYILCSGFVILKNGTRDIYGLKLLVGEKPTKITRTGVSGDHKSTIRYFDDLFSHSEKINTNKIEGMHVFSWIMDYRELVHYRINSFIEPSFGYDVLPDIFNSVMPYDEYVNRYLAEPNIAYCFLKEHSIYATPILFLKKAKDKLDSISTGEEILSPERTEAALSILKKMNLENSLILRDLLFQ